MCLERDTCILGPNSMQDLPKCLHIKTILWVYKRDNDHSWDQSFILKDEAWIE